MKWGVVAILLSVACGKEPWPEVKPAPRPKAAPERVAGAPADGKAPAQAVPAEVAPVAVSDEAVAALRPMLTAYDQAHAALTSDKLDGVAEAGRAIAEAARAGRALVTDQTLAAWLSDLEMKGRMLEGTDIEAVRLTYGELSKALVGVVSAVAPLREGRFVFQCPMAKGYQKWTQREPSLRNPYFGSAMLTCGDESGWAP